MYLYETITNPVEFIKCGVPAELLPKVKEVQVWCSSFKDPGPDYTLFVASDEDGYTVNTHKRAGY